MAKDPAPRKPEYKRLRVIASDEVMWGVAGWRERFLALIDRAEWLERERVEAKRREERREVAGGGITS